MRSRPTKGVGLELTLFRLDYGEPDRAREPGGGLAPTLTNGGQTRHQGLRPCCWRDGGALFARRTAVSGVSLTALPTGRASEGTRFAR